MDANAIAAALQDLLGPDVTWRPSTDDYGWWEWAEWEIDSNGAVYMDVEDCVAICMDAADLDKLHAASTVVRRMVGGGA